MSETSSASGLPESVKERRSDEPESVLDPAPESQGESTGPHLTKEVEQLRLAMGPIMQLSLEAALKKGNESLVESMYPLIGRVVRRSVRESLAALAQSVDTTMRDALTLKQLRWRLEARRRGVPLSQLVLEKSLLFRVEEVFLIHQETGLLIGHAGARADDSRDLVSGMFTAIQDFVADSFGGNSGADGSPDQLGRFQVGDQDVWLFHGPVAYMALVISGSAPASNRDGFHRVLEEIHERYGAQLRAFEGDSEPLKPATLMLDDCLVEQSREMPNRSPLLFWILAAFLLIGLLGWWWVRWQTRERHAQVRGFLEKQAGVVVTEEELGWRRSSLNVLADPGVISVSEALAAALP